MIVILNRKRFAMGVGIAAIAAVAVGVPLSLSSASPRTPTAGIPPRAGSLTTPVDFGNGLTFTPAGGPTGLVQVPKLTAQQAFADSGGSQMPSGLQYQTGSLTKKLLETTPTGGPEYVYNNRSVYAFWVNSPCEPGYGTQSLPADSKGCVTWDFVDAQTGDDVLETQERN